MPNADAPVTFLSPPSSSAMYLGLQQLSATHHWPNRLITAAAAGQSAYSAHLTANALRADVAACGWLRLTSPQNYGSKSSPISPEVPSSASPPSPPPLGARPPEILVLGENRTARTNVFHRVVWNLPHEAAALRRLGAARRRGGAGGIADLSQLKTLHLHGGYLALSADSGPPHPKLKIAHFAYTDLRAACASCFALLDPAALCSLELSPGGPLAIESLLADKAALAACRNLHTLRITFAASAFTRIHACISVLPALCALIVVLTDGVRVDASPLRPLAPHLERYTGPAGAMPEELTVTRGSAAEMLQALRTAGRPEWLAALSLNVSLYADMLDGAVLRDILSLCPGLVRLMLDMSSDLGIPLQNPGPPDTAKIGEILRVLSALESVFFRWRLEVMDALMVPPLDEL
ncbi:hypothetical protein DFH09DRAFT_1094313 [Mycena vulgaris]|nr:hypothetical protein DFH09DRAFT_1094313 [Mycena vulgaris]